MHLPSQLDRWRDRYVLWRVKWSFGNLEEDLLDLVATAVLYYDEHLPLDWDVNLSNVIEVRIEQLRRQLCPGGDLRRARQRLHSLDTNVVTALRELELTPSEIEVFVHETITSMRRELRGSGFLPAATTSESPNVISIHRGRRVS